MKTITWYIDLDGVGADWEHYVLSNHFPMLDSINTLNKLPDRPAQLREMYERDPHLFRKLSPMQGFDQLTRLLDNLEQPWYVLTAAGTDHPDYNTVRADKLYWLEKHFGINGNRVIVTETSEVKAKYSKYGCVLIDDYKKNCDAWDSCGGESIHYKGGMGRFESLITQMQGLIRHW